MSNGTLGIAVIGAGSIGQSHVDLIQGSPFSHLAGLCDITPQAAEVALRAQTTLYPDIETLIQHEAPDGIIIATPNGLHAAHAQLCAAHNIPMLIEKPVAGTLQDAYQIEQLVTEKGASILVGHYRRFNPLVTKCRALFHEGVIGKPVGVSVIWSLRKPDHYFEVPWRVQRQNGGPALINLIHEVDTLSYMLGKIETVFAQTSHATRQLEVEDTLSISIKFENGALGTILVSDAAASPWAYEAAAKERDFFGHSDENCYHFVGTEGALAFPRLEIWRYPQNVASDWQQTLERTTVITTPLNPMQLQFEHFLSVIKGEAQPLISVSDARRSLAAVIGILQSAEQHRPISLEEVLAR